MDDWIVVIGLSLAAGIAMPIGAAIALLGKLRPNWLENELRHSVVAFGGGALLSAVALVLVPEGTENLSILTTIIYFSLGAMAFMALDIYLASRKGSASQLVAMLLDFIPESLALGAAFAVGGESGPLLAGLITLQNLPEGFNACRELRDSQTFSAGHIIAAFSAMALIGPVAVLAGYLWLADYPVTVSCIMIFSAGGILYLIFQDIAPQAKLERRWAPALGSVAGFLLGLVGQMMISA